MRSRVAWLLIIGGFLGIAAVLVGTASADVQGGNLTFLPIASRAAPFDSDPPLDVYLGLVNATLDGDSDYYTVRADGSDLTPITDNDVDDNGGLWSPDGAWLTYYNEAGTFLQHRLTGELRTIGTTPYDEGGWSPNGQYLWWRQTDTGTMYLYDLHRDTTTTLTVPDLIRDTPLWSADSRYLAYIAINDASLNTLWVVSATTPTPHSLGTHERLRMEWAPNGKFLAFRSGPQEGETVYKWEAATATMTTIVEGYAFVAWFDQGQQVLLGHNDVLYSIHPNGTNIMPLHENDNIYRGVWVDPTNTRVLFQSGGSYFVLNSEQSGVVEIENRCNEGTYGCTDTYHWSPDGRYLIGSYEAVYRNNTLYYHWIIDTNATPPAFTHRIDGYGFESPNFLPFSEQYFEMADLIEVDTGTAHVVPLPEGIRPPIDWRYLP